MSSLRIGLDIDGVIARFSQSLINKAVELGYRCTFPCCENHITTWNFSPDFSKVWKVIEHDHKFWLNILPFDPPPFKPVVYCTSRPVPSVITKNWLIKHHMPLAKVETVPVGKDLNIGELKANALRKHKIDVFVDDNGDNVTELNRLGIYTLLLNRPWNTLYSDLNKFRIYSLDEIK